MAEAKMVKQEIKEKENSGDVKNCGSFKGFCKVVIYKYVFC